MKPLADRISDIRHRQFTLGDGDGCHRPHLSVFADLNEGETDAHVAIMICPQVGQQQRFVDLTPMEARALAAVLTQVSREVEVQMWLPNAEAAVTAEAHKISEEMAARPASHTDAFASDNDQQDYDDERNHGWAAP